MGATCSYILVNQGDSCASLATRCGISASDFTTYNPASDLCSTLQPKQPVCCSAGTLPDLSPKENDDGTCYACTVQTGEYCSLIADNYYLTVDKIETYNNQTWGWNGCNGLQAGAQICLSTGTPPMPAVVAGAQCGPQVNGTARPANWSDISSLNPCPLNACCSMWGSCGISSDYCAATTSSTGAPGTSGCISNCGTNIVNNVNAPATFTRVGYFEGYNTQRSCLTMNADQIPSGYSHIHFSFGTITSNFSIDMSSVQTQFNLFLKQTAFKKVLSFGGWSFSTDLDSYAVFSDGVKAANRAALAQSVVAAVQQYGLDGVDFDWEYVGITSGLPGVPAGSPDDGANYLAFLQTLRSLMPAGKTISIAAPASYWYLQHFPIAEISSVVDYIVYMTYDLHGQWDYGSSTSQSGCANGDCLRSHVNVTETLSALAMITKAGVPGAKVIVGVANYGRSFGMVDPSCTGPTCHYKGPDSTATPGRCTGTAGYLAEAEILEAIAAGATSWHDDDSNTDMATFADGTWVSYLSEDSKAFRRFAFQFFNLGGTVEWAVDLAAFVATTEGTLQLSSDNQTASLETVSSSAVATTASSATTLVTVLQSSAPTSTGVSS
ncbi:class V chitinase-like protein [Thozetella sp. PMI_491]|nr:class V chitinase-like protein [Thozetella sp. PMI_491]